jgi:hypothetical protein
MAQRRPDQQCHRAPTPDRALNHRKCHPAAVGAVAPLLGFWAASALCAPIGRSSPCLVWCRFASSVDCRRSYDRGGSILAVMVPGANVASDEVPNGWHPDPFGRYEERYFVHGKPTGHVRSDGIDATDAQGATASTEPSTAFAKTNDSGVESTPRIRSDGIEAADVQDATASLKPGAASAEENLRGELAPIVPTEPTRAPGAPESVASLNVAPVPAKPYEGHQERTRRDDTDEIESTTPKVSAALPNAARTLREKKQPQARAKKPRSRRRRLVFVVVGILVAVALALGGVKLFKSSRATPPNEKFLAMVGEIAKVSSNSPSVARQQKALLNERKHACRTTNSATIAVLARRAYLLEHATNANRRALGAGYLAAVTVSCPAKKQKFDEALTAVAARRAHQHRRTKRPVTRTTTASA